MSTLKSDASEMMERPAAVISFDEPPAPQPAGNRTWDFRAVGAFLRSNDAAWVRHASAFPPLAYALARTDFGPNAPAHRPSASTHGVR